MKRLFAGLLLGFVTLGFAGPAPAAVNAEARASGATGEARASGATGEARASGATGEARASGATGEARASGATEAPAPKVRLVVSKGKHEMTLYEGEQKGETFKVALGPGGAGHKHREGDKVTPVGRYHIIAKQPSQDFRTFLRLDYPNAEDRKRFAELKKAGALPKGATIGGDIGIHGAPRAPEWKDVHKKYDWTWGCVALDDQEIDRLAKKVPVGTVVDIED